MFPFCDSFSFNSDISFDFVEDIKVDHYLKKSFPDAWQNMTLIKTLYDKSFNDKIESSKKYAREKFSKHFVTKSKEISELKEKLSQNGNIGVILPYLDYLYKNQQQLPEIILPYCKHNDFSLLHKNLIKNIMIHPKGEFGSIVSRMDALWVAEKHKRDKWLSEYQKFARESNFDEVLISPENLAEFQRVGREGSSDLRRLRTTLTSFSTMADSPSFQEVGLLDLPSAVQRVGSQDTKIPYLQDDIPRRESENWVIIMDSSASMKLKSEETKKFAMCLSDTAERLGQTGGRWGMYSFNNNFFIVKDPGEKFSQQINARIGGLENQGLSFIPDAIEMGTKILVRDQKTAHKYLIIITDCKSLGYNNIDENFKRAIQYAHLHGVNVIGIGIPGNLVKFFTFAVDGEDLKKSVKKFFNFYAELVESQKVF